MGRTAAMFCFVFYNFSVGWKPFISRVAFSIASEHSSWYQSTRVDLKWFICKLVNPSFFGRSGKWSSEMGLANRNFLGFLPPFQLLLTYWILISSLILPFNVIFLLLYGIRGRVDKCIDVICSWFLPSWLFVATLKLTSFWQTTQANFSIVCVYW